jgi:hypothetical protein
MAPLRDSLYRFAPLAVYGLTLFARLNRRIYTLAEQRVYRPDSAFEKPPVLFDTF